MKKTVYYPASREPGYNSTNEAEAKLEDSYIPEPGLVDAINVALMLNKPLLVTGEPGTGKTTLVNSIAIQLGFDDVLKFETKSSTNARDLFYEYDNLGRFHARQENEAVNFITYKALGLAILRAAERGAVQDVLPPKFDLGAQRRSLVLIDEIDKAPRDVPNDILNEIDEMYFRIPELENMEIRARQEMRPVVILTSNSEKSLPKAFLRRCIYYHIEFPKRERLEQIVRAKVGFYANGSSNVLKEALDLFDLIRRGNRRLDKMPGTAELLDWLLALEARKIDPNASLKSLPKGEGIYDWDNVCRSTLFKYKDDAVEVSNILKEWRSKK